MSDVNCLVVHSVRFTGIKQRKLAELFYKFRWYINYTNNMNNGNWHETTGHIEGG